MRRRAFTLVEILIVVALSGVILAAGISPLVFTVRMLRGETKTFVEGNRERTAFNRMVRDIRDAISLNHSSPVRVEKSEELAGSERDALIVWNASASHIGEPAGCVVYAVTDGKSIGDKRPAGLHRWIISEDITKKEEDLRAILQARRSQLLVPGVDGLSIRALDIDSWKENYIGGVPEAIRITFIYGKDEKSYETLFPNAK